MKRLCCLVKTQTTCGVCNKKWCTACWKKERRTHRTKEYFTFCPKAKHEAICWDSINPIERTIVIKL